MEKFKIRKPRVGDAKSFSILVNGFVQEDAPLTGLKKITESEAKEALKKIIQDKSIIYYVIDKHGELIGYARIDKGSYSDKSKHIGLFGIGIKKAYRGEGYGYTLAEEALNDARKDPDLKIIESYVFSANKRGIDFFKNLGFKREAVLKKRIEYKNKLIDDVVMVLKLK